MKKYTDMNLNDSKFNDLVKHSSQKTLDCSQNNIYGSSVSNLEKNRHIETLILDKNEVGGLSIRNFAHSLAKNSSIKTLSLAHNGLGSEGLAILVDYLSDPEFSKSKIENLNLSYNSIFDLDDKTIENITKLKLKKLTLDGNSLGDKTSTLKKLIQKFQSSTTLTLLSCRDAKISPELFPDLILLAKKHHLKTLSFNGSDLTLDDQTRDFLCHLTKFSQIKIELWDIKNQICAEFANNVPNFIEETDSFSKVLTKQRGKQQSDFFKNINRERARAVASSSNEPEYSDSILNTSPTLKYS